MPLPPALRLFRSILRRSFADWPVTLAAAVLLLTAATVVAADGLYADVVTLGGLRRSIDQAPPDDRNVLISMRAAAAELEERDGILRSALGGRRDHAGLGQASMGPAPAAGSTTWMVASRPVRGG